MYCPNCGQQQVSNELRFCSRCGFAMSGVSALLATGGALPVYSGEEDEDAHTLSPRQKGIRQGVALMLIGLIVTPILAIIAASSSMPVKVVPLVAVITFWGGILRMLYALIFQNHKKKSAAPAPSPYLGPAVSVSLGDSARREALPPQREVPLADFRRADTSELVRPPSVTENTTRLLNEKDDPNAL